MPGVPPMREPMALRRPGGPSTDETAPGLGARRPVRPRVRPGDRDRGAAGRAASAGAAGVALAGPVGRGVASRLAARAAGAGLAVLRAAGSGAGDVRQPAVGGGGAVAARGVRHAAGALRPAAVAGRAVRPPGRARASAAAQDAPNVLPVLGQPHRLSPLVAVAGAGVLGRAPVAPAAAADRAAGRRRRDGGRDAAGRGARAGPAGGPDGRRVRRFRAGHHQPAHRAGGDQRAGQPAWRPACTCSTAGGSRGRTPMPR